MVSTPAAPPLDYGELTSATEAPGCEFGEAWERGVKRWARWLNYEIRQHAVLS